MKDHSVDPRFYRNGVEPPAIAGESPLRDKTGGLVAS